MGSLPRMIFIVNNAKFAQHAVMVPGQLSYFSLAHGSRADFDSIDATRLNTDSSDELELPLGQGPRQNSASSMGFKQARNFCYRGSEAAAGPSHGKQLHLNSGLHWEQPRFNLEGHISSLMAVYQILDNETGSLPRMIFIVNNAEFAQHAVMVPGQLSYFSLAHGSREDFSSTDATRINTG